MRYPFPGLDKAGHAKTYLAELPCLARTKPDSFFISSFNDVWALNFDELTHDFCDKFRKVDLASCDAIYPDDVNHAGRLYVIEFKDRSLNELNKQGSDGKDETIVVELSKKLQDSLLVLGSTGLRDTSMRDVQNRTEFIVVYADSEEAKEPESFGAFSNCLADMGKVGSDPQNITVLWELNRFKTAGFCKAVRTLSESQFKKYASTFMKRADGTSNF